MGSYFAFNKNIGETMINKDLTETTVIKIQQLLIMVVDELKKHNENTNTTNKILSSFLIQAVSESDLRKMNDKEIKHFVPKYIDTLNKVRDSAGLNE